LHSAGCRCILSLLSLFSFFLFLEETMHLSMHMDRACSPSRSSHWNAKPSEYDYSHISHLHTSSPQSSSLP
jgi:hypothetical protein